MEPLSEDVQKKVSQAVYEYPKAWRHGVCAFVIFNKKTGAQRGGKTGDICHASLNRANDPSIIVNAHKDTWQKVSSDFLLWVTQEGPFSHGVLNRDNKDELLNHASVLDTELIGKGGALWTCKALRHFVEDDWVPSRWSQLREYGLDGLQAFIGADILTSAGEPKKGHTHVGLFTYNSPAKLRKVYDEIRGIKRIDTSAAARNEYSQAANWGSLAGKVEKKKDGWGGFVEVRRPCDAKEYAAKLKEIFEGDPKNVG